MTRMQPPRSGCISCGEPVRTRKHWPWSDGPEWVCYRCARQPFARIHIILNDPYDLPDDYGELADSQIDVYCQTYAGKLERIFPGSEVSWRASGSHYSHETPMRRLLELVADPSYERLVEQAWLDAIDAAGRAERIDQRPAIERYGTPEHEAWLIEMERYEP